MPRERKSETSDLAVILSSIRRRIWVVAACLVVAILASIGFTLKAEEQYASTSSLLLSPSNAIEPQRTVETNLELLSLPILAGRTADALDTGLSAEEVEDSIEVSQQGESDIVRIKATANSPDAAADMANIYADKFLSFKEGPEAEAGGEGAGTVRIVEKAEPEDDPVSPNAVKNVIFGALIGLVLGLGLALLLEQLDTRVKREDDLPDVTDLPILATIPRRKSLTPQGLGEGAMTPAEAELFLRLRANLRYFNPRREVSSLLVTSAGAGEGKTVVSLGLALAGAMTGERVLLIEADLRDPSLAETLSIPSGRGLSWVLEEDNHDSGEAIVPFAAGQIARSAGNSRFDVLTAGSVPPNPTERIASRRMSALLAEAEQMYDLVIIDSPPILLVADTISLASRVSGVLAVSGVGVSSRDAVAELAEDLDRMEAATLGMVVNFAAEGGRSLEGYGYGRPPELAMSKPPAGRRGE